VEVEVMNKSEIIYEGHVRAGLTGKIIISLASEAGCPNANRALISSVRDTIFAGE
jgi:hypothetical protein